MVLLEILTCDVPYAGIGDIMVNGKIASGIVRMYHVCYLCPVTVSDSILYIRIMVQHNEHSLIPRLQYPILLYRKGMDYIVQYRIV